MDGRNTEQKGPTTHKWQYLFDVQYYIRWQWLGQQTRGDCWLSIDSSTYHDCCIRVLQVVVENNKGGTGVPTDGHDFREHEHEGVDDVEGVVMPVDMLIPIGVLFIIVVATGSIWLLIPILVLIVSLVSSVMEERRIQARKAAVYNLESPIPAQIDTKSIYDHRKRKDEGVAAGVLIPIGICAIFYFISGFSWGWLIPLSVLLLVFLSSVVKNASHRSKVLSEFGRGQGRTVPEIAGSAGVPQDAAIQFIIGQKRMGASDVWFDPSTGITGSTPVRPPDTGVSRARGCIYCGFALKPEDRYCPYCGAPIKAV